MHDQIAWISALAKDAVVRVFDDDGQTMKSNSDTNVKLTIWMIINRVTARAFQTALMDIMVEEYVDRFVLERHIAESVARHIFDALFFSAFLTKSVNSRWTETSLKASS